MHTTMRDVALEAGVSIRTVSRVVNDKDEIAADTRERVLAAIAKLDYRPNTLARGLVSGKTSTIGVVIPQISDPFFPEFLQGVESIARNEGYSVFLCNTDEDADKELQSIEVLAAKQVDGIILCGSYLSDEQLQNVSKRYHVAIVTSRTPQSTAVVSIPGKNGLDETTSYLIALGHKRIGYLGKNDHNWNERFEGYLNAMKRYGLPVDDKQYVLIRNINIEASTQAAHRLISQDPDITAIACYNDLAAIGVLQACREMGKNVPNEIAVVGFDDIPLASLVTPSLTTMHVPRHSLGERVTRMLLRVMDSNGRFSEYQQVPVELIVRESCGMRTRTSKNAAEFFRLRDE